MQNKSLILFTALLLYFGQTEVRAQSTRIQYARKAKRLRFLFKLVSIFESKPKGKSLAKELYIDTEFGKVRVLVYGLDNTSKTPVLFTLHQGGFVLGKADIDESMNREFLNQTGCKVISIDYPLAPENPYPAAVNQVYAAVNYFYDNAKEYHLDRDKMAIGGHSAGGNLTAVTTMKAKKEGKFKFVCQFLDYPPLDLATNPYEKTQPKGAISPNFSIVFNNSYCDSSQSKNPYVSPVFATKEDLEGLPPALFILPGKDGLHDEGLKYCNMLKNAGVETEYIEYTKAKHGFTYKKSDDATDALKKMIQFIKKNMK